MVRPLIITLIIWILSTGFSFANVVALDMEPFVETITTLRKDLEAENYQDALVSANLIIRLLEKRDETDSSGYVSALLNMAVNQKRSGSTADSERSFLKVIGIIEQSDRGYSTRLINILGNLASLYYQTNRYTEALETLRRAQQQVNS
ncbi:MAG: tetratricopeptide repeat protein [Gammaproteobacteria bacterium]|nr:tetratricopeptide repeat protein [Gammaproteobacteria bacterium]